MGPHEDCLALAREIKKEHPEVTTDEIALAYTIQNFVEKIEAEAKKK